MIKTVKTVQCETMQEEKVTEKVTFLPANSWFPGIGFAMIRKTTQKVGGRGKCRSDVQKNYKSF